jgi:hypothetical protein
MVIDMTNELAPILYGILGITLVSGLSIFFAAWHAAHPRKPRRRESPRRPVPALAPRGIFISPRVMHAASSHAH